LQVGECFLTALAIKFYAQNLAVLVTWITFHFMSGLIDEASLTLSTFVYTKNWCHPIQPKPIMQALMDISRGNVVAMVIVCKGSSL